MFDFYGQALLNESCWPKILYRKIMAIKQGSKLERCSAGNLDDLLWKYCKSRYADLSCSDVHWNFWRMCNALRLGSEVCNWHRLAFSPIWRIKKEDKCLKMCTVLILHFAPSLHFTLSLQSAFYTQSVFYSWSAVCSLQSAVCSPQSAFYTGRLKQLKHDRMRLRSRANKSSAPFLAVKWHSLAV